MVGNIGHAQFKLLGYIGHADVSAAKNNAEDPQPILVPGGAHQFSQFVQTHA